MPDYFLPDLVAIAESLGYDLQLVDGRLVIDSPMVQVDFLTVLERYHKAIAARLRIRERHDAGRLRGGPLDGGRPKMVCRGWRFEAHRHEKRRWAVYEFCDGVGLESPNAPAAFPGGRFVGYSRSEYKGRKGIIFETNTGQILPDPICLYRTTRPNE